MVTILDHANTRRKRIAVIGSSGGGAATLGHTNIQEFLALIQNELAAVRCDDDQSKKSGDENILCCLAYAILILLPGGKGMDSADESSDRAKLVVHKHQHDECIRLDVVGEGRLKDVNLTCAQIEQKTLASMIRANQIHGLICISVSTSVFRDVFLAAADKSIPVTGSGGTSIAQIASEFGIKLVGNSGGSVATTSYTRAVSYAHAFSTYWNGRYEPWRNVDNKNEPAVVTAEQPSTTSILNACLPIFWGSALLKFLLQRIKSILGEASHPPTKLSVLIDPLVQAIEGWVLPVGCAITVATSSTSQGHTANRRHSVSSIVMATILASISSQGSVLGGLLVGHLVPYTMDRIFFWLIFKNVPATMTNLTVIGAGGGFVALLGLVAAPLLRRMTATIRTIVSISVTMRDGRMRLVCGALWGIWSCYGSKVGWYHRFHLPLILVEMEHGEPSFLGAIDELSLVLVSAGISCAVLVSAITRNQHSVADVSICQRGAIINLLCGDFVEVCYPFMERYPFINFAGYAASAISSSYLAYLARSPDMLSRSLAYLPLPLSIALAGPNWQSMGLAAFLAFGVSFSLSIVGLIFSRNKRA
jgi:hypothetical protein